VLISASAIGYYGTQNHKYIDEKSSYIDDFTHKLVSVNFPASNKYKKL
jgi:NAD dependent epimerase/dehydratase family enzyme